MPLLLVPGTHWDGCSVGSDGRWEGRGGEEEEGTLGGRWGFWEIVGVVVGEGRRRGGAVVGDGVWGAGK